MSKLLDSDIATIKEYGIKKENIMSKVYFWYEADGECNDQVARIFSDEHRAVLEIIKTHCSGKYYKTLTPEKLYEMAKDMVHECEIE